MLTYGSLEALLAGLEFVDESVPGSHRAYRHHKSGTLLLFPLHAFDEKHTLVSPQDQASVHRHLIEGGFLDEADWDLATRREVIPSQESP